MTKYSRGKKVSPLPNIFATLVCMAMMAALVWMAVTQGGTPDTEPITNCVAGTYLQADNTCLPLDSTRSK